MWYVTLQDTIRKTLNDTYKIMLNLHTRYLLEFKKGKEVLN